MTKIKVQTKGMHCPSCEMLIKDELEELGGIHKVNASHKTGVIEVDFDSQKVAEENIIEIIKNQGYEIK